MPGKKQKAKERLDKFYDLAKSMGYRSRAAFKLIQLNKKYDFLSKAKTVVDLCAAPGSWSQIAAKEMPAGSTIIAVDLVKIAPLRGVKTLVGDITTDKTRSQIKAMLDKRRCEVVIHDGAPNVGGTWAKDAYNQNLLTLKACKLACELLLPDGWFVTKIFRSTDSERLIYVFRQLFEKVEKFKPAASRQQSAEVFVVCAGYKAPKKLDPNLFSAKAVFEMIDDNQRVDKSDPTDQMHKRDTTFYPEGKMLLYEKATVEEFLATDDPKQFLQYYNVITWDGSEELLEHKTTNEDVTECFKDLKVISKWNQNKLIKWAKNINRERQELARDIRDADKEAERLGAEHVEEDDNDDEKILREIDDMNKRDAKSKKRAERKMIDRKLLQAERLGYNPEDHEANKQEFFEFSKTDMEGVEPPEVTAEDYDEHAELGMTSEIPGLDIHKTDNQGRDMVMDMGSDEDEDEDEDEVQEEQKGITPREQQALTTGDYYKSIERVFNNAYKNREDYHSDEDVTESEDDEDSGIDKWVDSSEEGDSSTDDDEDSDSVAQERSVKRQKTTETRKSKSGAAAEQTVQQAVRSERLEKTKAKKRKRAPGGFEEIPTEMRDPETRARTLAIAQQMLEGKRRKREILEEGIHRFCHAVDEGLPKWFTDEEKRHNVRPLPVTKDEVEVQKSRFKEINARPAKKVAEAVARRRKRASDKLRRILVKEKSDPRLNGTSQGLTVRKMMRSKDLRRKKESKNNDAKSQAEDRLAKKKAKIAGKMKGKSKGKGKGKGKK